ncbi:SURF1 family protein [Jannaschia sp. 2305UL9-9]|uniref:SURF1 family protein n=1 Tax=Jannaschia sp. 2305UL9-9 TaxID=3121638 RepID=UPI003529171C
MRFLIPLIFGLGGFAVLVSLGLWQVQRLSWKEAILADIETRIAAAPVAVPATPEPEDDRLLPVTVGAEVTGDPIRVLASAKGFGPGYRLIYPVRTDSGRALMIDFGLIPVEAPLPRMTGRAMDVTGNLHWPDEVDGFTPEPDLGADIWFARDVPAMAAALGVDPVLIIARASDPTVVEVTPVPVTTDSIPNSHLGYAIQWFGLAFVWLGMTVFLLWRIRRRTV